MRVLRVCPEMPAFLDPEVATCHKGSFSETQDAYREHGLIFPGGWKDAFERHGHDVMEVVFADSFSQLQWANELFRRQPDKFLSQIETASLEEILAAQIDDFDPDCVIYYTGVLYRLNSDFRQRLKKQFPSVRFVCVWGDQIPKDLTLKRFFAGIDAFGACSRGYFETLETLGKPVVLVQSGFDSCYVDQYLGPSFASRPIAERDIDVLFVGNTGYKCYDHVDRYFFITKMLETSPLKFAGIEKPMSLADRFFRVATALGFGVFNNPLGRMILRPIYPRLGRLGLYLPNPWDQNQDSGTRQLFIRARYPFVGDRPLSKRYRDRYLGSVFSQKEYFKLLSRAKIVVNLHRKDPSDYGNLRVWEAIGMGCFLLTDKAFEIADLVTPDTIQNIHSWEDASESCRYFLADVPRAQRMAREAQRQGTENGTVFHRLSELSEMVEKVCADQSGYDRNVSATEALRFCYDLRSRPLSYDFIFFLEYCVVTQRQSGASHGHVEIILPAETIDFHERYGWTINEFNYRVEHLILPLAKFFPSLSVEPVVAGSEEHLAREGSWDPVSVSGHHREFYRLVNASPESIEPIFANRESTCVALRQIEQITDSYDKIVTLTVRESKEGVDRNVSFKDYGPLVERLGELNVGVLVLPEVGTSMVDDRELPPWVRVVRDDLHQDFDVRLAIYEAADLNIFPNNGPCVASELDPKVRSLMFNLVVPSVPHCTVDYIESQGYRYGDGPSYNNRSVWLWEEKVGDNLIACVEGILNVE